jgi:hypothetical protein
VDFRHDGNLGGIEEPKREPDFVLRIIDGPRGIIVVSTPGQGADNE